MTSPTYRLTDPNLRWRCSACGRVVTVSKARAWANPILGAPGSLLVNFHRVCSCPAFPAPVLADGLCTCPKRDLWAGCKCGGR